MLEVDEGCGGGRRSLTARGVVRQRPRVRPRLRPRPKCHVVFPRYGSCSTGEVFRAVTLSVSESAWIESALLCAAALLFVWPGVVWFGVLGVLLISSDTGGCSYRSAGGAVIVGVRVIVGFNCFYGHGSRAFVFVVAVGVGSCGCDMCVGLWFGLWVVRGRALSSGIYRLSNSVTRGSIGADVRKCSTSWRSRTSRVSRK